MIKELDDSIRRWAILMIYKDKRALGVKLIRSLDVATVRFKALKWRNRSVK